MNRLYNAIKYCYDNGLLKNVYRTPFCYSFKFENTMQVDVECLGSSDTVNVFVHGKEGKTLGYRWLEHKLKKQMTKFFIAKKKEHKNKEKKAEDISKKMLKEWINSTSPEVSFAQFFNN